MKKFAMCFAAVVLLASGLGSVHAVPSVPRIYDQMCESGPNGSLSDGWQEFTPSSPVLSGIEIFTSKANGDGNFLEGVTVEDAAETELASWLPTDPFATGWLTAKLDLPLVLAPGEKYTIRVNTSGSYFWKRCAESYPGGQGGPAVIDWDFMFRTVVLTSPI